MRRLWCAALGALLLASPVLAQGGKCQGNSGSASSSTASATSTATTVSSSGSGTVASNTNGGKQALIATLQNQIAQSEQLLVALQTGQVSPPAGSGVTSQQAQQMVSRRIVALRNAVTQVAVSNSSTTMARTGAAASGRRR